MQKVKIKQIKKVVGDVDLNGMFEEMVGAKDADPKIIIPKFVGVRNTLRYIYRVLNQFATMQAIRADFPNIVESLDQIKKFADDMKESTYLKHDHDEKEDAFESVDKTAINDLYRKLKENEYVKKLIIMCNKLDKYKTNFNDPNKLKENFVNQEPGLSFMIFDFSTLDLKILWSDSNMKPFVKKYILTVLANLHKHSYTLYNTIMSPDVDIGQFTSVLLTSIDSLKDIPELHRCKNAFRRIEQSVELLKDKFSDYYKDSIASQNPDTLITSFIVDVSNQGGADAKLTREFRTIIQYMNKISQKTGKSKDPTIKKIFAMLNKNFSLMDQQTGVSTKPEPDGTETNDTETKEPETSASDTQTTTKKKKKKNKKKSVSAVDDADEVVDNVPELVDDPTLLTKIEEEGFAAAEMLDESENVQEVQEVQEARTVQEVQEVQEAQDIRNTVDVSVQDTNSSEPSKKLDILEEIILKN